MLSLLTRNYIFLYKKNCKIIILKLIAAIWLRSPLSADLNTQWLQNSAESGERSVFTLGSLWLPCYVRIQRESDLFFDMATQYMFLITIFFLN